jgi:RNA polymerase sigma factor (sigma-70 family)
MSIPLRSTDTAVAARRIHHVMPGRPRPTMPIPDEPDVLSWLLAATNAAEQERAWERFLEVYSGLILRSACGSGRSYDGVMDRYAFVLDQLRMSNFRRLRQFQPRGSARFTTWLVVVARRLCLDHARRLYGRRVRPESQPALHAQAMRRRLVDLVAERVEVTEIAEELPSDPDALLASFERRRQLESVLTGLDSRSVLLLKLRFGKGMTAREIGELMGYPTQFHVFRQLNRLLGRIRRALLEAGVDGSGV